MPTKKNLTDELPNDKTLIEGYAKGVAVDKTGDIMTGNLEAPSMSIGGDFVSVHSFRNKFINGCFRTWERGTTKTLPFTDYLADRWIIGSANTTGSVSKFSDTEHDYIDINITSATVGTSYLNLSQKIEDVRTMQNETTTLSFKVGTSTLTAQKAVVVVEQYFGVGGSTTVTSNYEIDITPNTKHSLSIDIPSTAGKTIGTGSSLIVSIRPTNYVFANINGQTGRILITKIQLEKSSVATPFEQRPIGLELSLCQRYYEKSSNMRCISRSATVSTIYSNLWTFAVEKRTIPTVILSGMFVTGGTLGNATSTVIGEKGFNITDTTGSYTTGQAVYVGGAFTADAEL